MKIFGVNTEKGNKRMTTHIHIIIILTTVLLTRVLIDIITFLVKRHKEKEDEKRVKEYELKCLNERLCVLEKDINTIIQEREGKQ